MTKHPLTDEICEQIRDSIPEFRRDEQGHILSYDGQRILDGMFEELFEVSNAEMRSAADWQLEQCLNYIRLTYGDGAMIPFMEAMIPFMEAIRPQGPERTQLQTTLS